MSMVDRIAMSDRYSSQVLTSARGMNAATVKETRGKWIAGNVFLLIFTMLLGFVFSIRTAESAHANWFSDALEKVFCSEDAFFNDPQPWSTGIMSMGIANPIMQDGVGLLNPGDPTFLDNRHTAYEKYGMSGTNWTVYKGESTSEINDRGGVSVTGGDNDLRTHNKACWPIQEVSSTYLANVILGTTKFVTAISSWLFAQAYEPTWLNDINDKIAVVISGENGEGGLKDALYFPFLSLTIFLGALYLGYIGLIKKQSMQAGTSAIWMVGCVLVGSVLVFNPALVPSMANSLVQEVSQAILVGTAGATTGNSMDKDNLCYTPDVASSNLEAKRSQIVATASCSFWVTFVYTPWAVGQFGVPPDQLDGQLNANAITKAPVVSLGGGAQGDISNWALFQLESQSLDAYSLSQDSTTVLQQKEDNWYKVVDALGSSEGATNLFSSWKGNAGMDRLQVSTASVVAATSGLIVVAVLAITMLAYGLGTSILSFFSVIFLLIGAHPGIGRSLALKWAEMYVGTILKRVFTALMLSMVLTFYGAILTTTTGSWLSSVMAMIALSVAVLMYRKTIMSAVGEVNFGGSGIGTGEAKRAGQKLKGVTSGALLGAAASVGGAAVVAKAAAGTAGLSKVQKVGKAVAGGSAVIAKGAGSGAVRGMMVQQSGIGQIMALRDASRQATSAGSKAVAEAKRVNKKVDARIDTPEELSQFKQQLDKNAQRYEKDYRDNKDDPRWQELFRDRYGFAPPDASIYRFAGYGMKREELLEKENHKYFAPQRKSTGDSEVPPPEAPLPPRPVRPTPNPGNTGGGKHSSTRLPGPTNPGSPYSQNDRK